ncbi:winged helix-turn-helix domain-containing protein [Streptantibioticus rubrisoli]|uniref:Winged helix-turn-helix domain-containing protein n=1 Tax=Streptantibioticus rubrisoli TaxID=1387313 RepID=A0ABT1PLY2_9ACTN|nr:winged helix-turn-helix domain-containing protein [Streptantibioticus rubrisoli]MCQ4046373.1 winged helix-turn-helix domain-containing protein [Streptantibioticus rubrisoli]
MPVRYPRAHRHAVFIPPLREIPATEAPRAVPSAQAVTAPEAPRAVPSAQAVTVPEVSSAPGLTVDTERRVASIDGRVLKLTYLEFELLAHLVAHPRRVHSRDQLIAAVWNQPAVGGTRTVDVHIARLRGKLGAAHRQLISTVRQVGYRYTPAPASPLPRATMDGRDRA